MPSKSKRQHDFMEAVAHNKAFAKKVGVPQSVGEDFAKADKGKHFKKGGINMATRKRSVNPAMAMMAARAMPTPVAAPMAPTAGPMGSGMKHGGLSKEHHKHLAHHHLAMAEHHMKEKETMGPRNMKKDVEAGSNKHGKFGESKDQKRGHTRGHNLGDSGKREPIETEKNMKSFMKKMASGGSTSSRADGIAKRGHTKTKYC